MEKILIQITLVLKRVLLLEYKMKYKGILVLFFVCNVLHCAFSSPNVLAKNSFAISPLFLLHSIHTKVTRDESKTDDEYRSLIRSTSDDVYRDISFCVGSSLDLNIDIVYLSFKFAHPFQFDTSFLNFPYKLLINNSVITDFEVGLCYKTFEKKPYNLVFCLGLGFGTVYMNAKTSVEENKKISYTRLDFMLGLGGNILFNYTFHKVVGIYFGIGDMFYFMNIRTYRLVDSSTAKIIFEEKLKSENFNAINTFANSLSLKMGLLFAF